jgi:hypothetical protein
MANRRLIANLGDENPFDHGGYFIYQTPTGIDAFYWDVGDDDGPVMVYQFPIEPDVAAALNWMKESDWKSIATFIGKPVLELHAHMRDPNPLIRADIYRAVGGYHGFVNLDQYPTEMSRRELVRTFDPALRGLARRRG